MIGQTISHYRIIAKLGEGGMGVVYLAEDTHLARRVAIKFLSSSDPLYRARFLREARAVSALSHPNIAAVYDYGETEDGQPYIVMELVKGKTLSKLLEEDTLTLVRSIEIIISIAAALGEAHHQGIVHRDVKPSNVVVNERGQVKVLDFGLVKQLAETGNGNIDPSASTLFSVRTRSDVIVGTPLYLSPEQATGKPVDGRSDLFALGAVLYECITGRSAFAGQSVIEIGAQVIHVNPPAPSKISLGIPGELDRITMKALEKKVDLRYQTAEEFLKDLREVLPRLDASQIAKPISRLTSPSVPLRTSALTTLTETLRRPRVSLGTLAIAVVGIVLLIVGLGYILRPKPYKPTEAALKWYNDGTDALRNGLFLQAKLAFDQAVGLDKDFPMAHARLAEALNELDYIGDAKDEMLRVTELIPNRSQLPRVEALYLEALHSKVMEQPSDAIAAYKEIINLSPDEPHAYFDLGRAYEKNNELEKAIESYIEATHRDSQLAPAFLRVGVLYGRKSDQAAALANFERAQVIYQAGSRVEGQAEVFYERGFMFNKVGKIADARAQLQQALTLAETIRNEYQQVKILLKLGDVASDEANVTQARQHIQQALNLAQAHGIDKFVKRGLVDLANTYISSGDYFEAEKYFTQSLDLARKQKDSGNSARALLSLGALATRQNHSDKAIDYIEQALPFFEKGGFRVETSQALALLARARVNKGEYDAALKVFEHQLKLSQQYDDQLQMGLTHGDIGLVMINQGRYPEALGHFEDSYLIAKSLGHKKNMGLSLTNKANALWRLGRYDEARLALEQASEFADQAETSKNLRAWYILATARMAFSQREFHDARGKSQKALSLAGTQLTDITTAATSMTGLVQVFSGAAQAGRMKCEEALRLAEQTGNPALISEALLALSQAFLLERDAQSALTTALRSQGIFAQCGDHTSEWLAWLVAAKASQMTGDNVKAQDYAKRGADLLFGMQLKWGAESFNTYLKRPDIQYFHQWLGEIRAE